ncbi:MFS transporter [Alterisphingorhabdus coralli]|uniref:MFS transporter n=1 Tax=Alterisphingorhabdus coralli TaxID=3071408 RepID=A0AA97F9I0_9SPHN|nr:MFS transporter [Parasphingorhabdus sp. SCSIO 66989]WOE75522.1 MFS transporter [Parasphingorhabdus sp. SCSIO 66989]
MTGQSAAPGIAEKPRQSFWGLWNISFGFFGIQIGFALQNSNMSRIFETLGTAVDDLPALWVAAPLTGLLVQPIIGYFSDKTWTKLGRRRPYFLAGAILAAISLFIMPLAPYLLFAAFMLWVLDASLNVSMEPFRAFVGDMLRTDQHTAGYIVQTGFIGAGACIGSFFPFFLDWAGVANVAPPGVVPDTVRYSFWFGAVVLFLAVLWTVVFTREYSPDEMRRFEGPDAEPSGSPIRALAAKSFGSGMLWIAAGALVLLLVNRLDLEKEVYLLGGLLVFYGLASMLAIQLAKAGNRTNMLSSIVGDFSGMPEVMKRLAVVQFFSWSALFIMWIFTTRVVAQYVWGTTDSGSAAFNQAGNWVGVLFGIYNGVAAVAALTLLPLLSRRLGAAYTHAACLLLGALGFLGFMFIRDQYLLILCEIGIGILWASVLAMPYAILASNLPQSKLGIYMGLFNIFIVIPQLLVATVMGQIMLWLFPDDPIWTMAFAAGSLAIAAFFMLPVQALLQNKARQDGSPEAEGVYAQ